MFLALAHKSAAYRVGPCCAKTVQFKSERRMSAGIEDESEAKGILDAATLRRYSYEVSMGSLFGFAAGKATRFFGKAGAGLVGTAFIAMQTLSYYGYVDVKWEKAERDFTAFFDVDKDGAVTTRDIGSLMDSALEVLKYNMPAGTGFTGGFLYGVGLHSTTAIGAGALYGAVGRMALPRLVAAGSVGVGGPTVAIESLQENKKKSLGDKTSREAAEMTSQVAEYREHLRRMRAHEMDIEEAFLKGKVEGCTGSKRAELQAKLNTLQAERQQKRSSLRSLFPL